MALTRQSAGIDNHTHAAIQWSHLRFLVFDSAPPHQLHMQAASNNPTSSQDNSNNAAYAEPARVFEDRYSALLEAITSVHPFIAFAPHMQCKDVKRILKSKHTRFLIADQF